MVGHNKKYNRHLANKHLKTQSIRATSNNKTQADNEHQEFINQVTPNSPAANALKQLALAVTFDVLNHGPQLIGMIPGVAAEDKKFVNIINDSIKHIKTADNPLFPISGDNISKWHTKDLLQSWGTNPLVQDAIISSMKNIFATIKDRVKPFIQGGVDTNIINSSSDNNAGTPFKEKLGKYTNKVINERKPALKHIAGQKPSESYGDKRNNEYKGRGGSSL
jgi:hypothetical protein